MRKGKIYFAIIALCFLGIFFTGRKQAKAKSLPLAVLTYASSLHDKFNIPGDLGICGSQLCLVDYGNRRIQTFKIKNDGWPPTHVSNFGKEGTNLGEFNFGRFLSFADYGKYCYIADSGNNRIQIFSVDEKNNLAPLSATGKEGKELGNFLGLPNLSLAVSGQYLYVGDSGNSRIQVFNIGDDGKLTPKLAFGKAGENPGEFGLLSKPIGTPGPLYLTASGHYLYVYDSGNSRIQVLSIKEDGALTPKFAFNQENKKSDKFIQISGITAYKNHLFLADSGSNLIHIFTINYDGSLEPEISVGKNAKNGGEIGKLFGICAGEKFLYCSDTEKNALKIYFIEPFEKKYSQTGEIAFRAP